MLLDALAKYEAYLKTPEGKSNPNPMQDNTTIIVPNTISFTNAITAYARSTLKDAPYKAEEILDKMHSLYKGSGMKHVKPNVVSYNSVINAYAKSKVQKGGRRAEKLLQRLFEFYVEEGANDDLIKPDSRTFNSVINAGAY
jgi:hypothetical protein